MNNRKNHNSILFLTTLGVYLGLVLVGATPQVLSQASTDLREAERAEAYRRITEECNNLRPRIERRSKGNYQPLTNSINDYLNALIDLAIHANCTSPAGFAFTGNASYPADLSLASSVSHRPKPSSKELLVSGLLSTHIETVANSLPHMLDRGDFFFEIDFEMLATGFQAVAKFKQNSPETAEQIADLYESNLSNWKISKHLTNEVALYDKTFISVENNQVLIVTRLPRAGLDTLLAKDAK